MSQSLTTPGASGADQPQIYGLLAPLMASAAAVYGEMKLYEEMEPIYAVVGDDVHDFIQVTPLPALHGCHGVTMCANRFGVVPAAVNPIPWRGGPVQPVKASA